MEIRKYVTDDGRCPFDRWFKHLRDQRARARILIRLNRMQLGLFGDTKAIGEGVHEIRVTEGKGYRIYYGLVDNAVILLLCGGNKSTQSRDIRQAIEYWREFRGISHG